LPPSTKVKILLTKNDPKFFLQCEESDNGSYNFEIVKAALYVPVAQLTLSVYNELSSIMSQKHDPKPVSIHFRRIELRVISLPHSKQDYYSSPMFAESDLPCKIILMFVESDAFLGNHHKNPFEFGRKWSVQVSTRVDKETEEQSRESRDFFDQRFLRLEKKFEDFLAKFHVEQEVQQKTFSQKGKGKGKGKKSAENLDEIIEKEANKRYNALLNKTLETCATIQQEEAERASTSSFQVLSKDSRELRQGSSRCSFMTNYDDPLIGNQTATITVYLKNIQLLLNSTPLDQIDEAQTRNQLYDFFLKLKISL